MRWAGHAAYMWRTGMHIGFWWESQKKRDHQEDELKCYLREIGWDGMYYIDLAPDRNQWRVLVNTVVILRVP
jgi:hypothetical protein